MTSLKTGDRFHRLVFVSPEKSFNNSQKGLFTCDCGNTITTYVSNVRAGKKKSCGCLRAETYENPKTIHGLSKTGAYSSWYNMMARCYQPATPGYERYGGRGIKVCQRWYDPVMFCTDMGERPQNTSIDRINNDGDYEPTNCRWATKSTQMVNSRKRNETSSIYKGVSFDKRTKKWGARITLKNGKYKVLGKFNTQVEAFEAYRKQYKIVHGFDVLYPTRQDAKK